MNTFIYIFILIFTVSSCNSQSNKKGNSRIGGPCEGCEALLEYDDSKLSAIDTLPKFSQTEPKLLVTGTIFSLDRKTPAENVILYIYHTNRQGIYETKGNEQGWAKRHGYIRGWIKTGENGKYSFYTFRPGAYPDLKEPEHIHMTVKEEGKNEYYIDDILFKDDSLLTQSIINNCKNRGGSGIVKPINKNDLLIVKRDIVLGLNIPDYH